MTRKLLFILLLGVCCLSVVAKEKVKTVDQTIFVYGGDITLKYTGYVKKLTNKSNPRICYVPTASADNSRNIKLWNFFCKKLNIESHVLKVWVSSNEKNQSFEEQLLSMDAIVVGGGNTLNMLGIWKAQGIDKIMKKALEKGIILSGGSAGSICWFQGAISDSRPVKLSLVNGLGFLPYSNCHHYGQKERKALYHDMLKDGTVKSGYASDDLSAILFKNGKVVEVVNLDDVNNSYFVEEKGGEIHAKLIPGKILVNDDALPKTAYTQNEVNKKVSECKANLNSPQGAFVKYKQVVASGKMTQCLDLACASLRSRLDGKLKDKEVAPETSKKHMNTVINKVLIYDDNFAGVINRMSERFYGIWYFHKEGGKWLSVGEDIGGATLLAAEITFREKAKLLLERME
jgi:peptidase E